MNNTLDIKEIAGSILLAIIVVVLGWLYCMATPNQLSGEGDWDEQAIKAVEETEERGECAAPKIEKVPPAQAIAEEYAKGDLVFAGANMEDLGKKVVVTLTFARN